MKTINSFQLNSNRRKKKKVWEKQIQKRGEAVGQREKTKIRQVIAYVLSKNKQIQVLNAQKWMMHNKYKYILYRH